MNVKKPLELVLMVTDHLKLDDDITAIVVIDMNEIKKILNV
jgi:hypothetical protein